MNLMSILPCYVDGHWIHHRYITLCLHGYLIGYLSDSMCWSHHPVIPGRDFLGEAWWPSTKSCRKIYRLPRPGPRWTKGCGFTWGAAWEPRKTQQPMVLRLGISPKNPMMRLDMFGTKRRPRDHLRRQLSCRLPKWIIALVVLSTSRPASFNERQRYSSKVQWQPIAHCLPWWNAIIEDSNAID